MNCEDLKQRIPDILTGEMNPKDRAAIDAHLADCGPCTQELRQVTETWAKLGVLPNEQPSPALRDRFYTMLEAYQSPSRDSSDVSPWRNSEFPASGTGAPTPIVQRFYERKSGELRQGIEARIETPESRVRGTSPGNFPGFHRPAFRFAAAAALLLAGVAGGVFLSRTGPFGSRFGRLQAEVNDLRQTTALSLLRQTSSSERLLGVGYSELVRTPGRPTIEALIRTLDEDSSVNVRLAAAEALYLFAADPQVREGVIASLGRQSSPLVQIALIDLLVGIREKRASEALKTLIDRKMIAPEVKQRAEQGLRQITT